MKRVLKFILFFAVILSFLLLIKAFFLSTYQDFNYYYLGSQAAFNGINPYLDRGYQYPPIFLLFLFPFKFFPLLVASKLWLFVSLVCLIAAVIIMLRTNNKKLLTPFSLIVFFCTFMFFPVKMTFGMGQINTLILLSLVLACYCLAKGKNVLSGIFFSLAISIKFFPLFIFIYLLLRKQWTILFSIITATVLFFAVGFFIFDSKVSMYFFSHVFFPLLSSSDGSYYYNQALSGFVARTVSDTSLRLIFKIALSLIIVCVTLFVMYKKQKINKQTILFELGILIIINLLLDSFAWQHHFVWILIPLIFTATYVRTRNEYIFLFIIFCLLAFNIKNPLSVPVILQSHVFYGALLLWVFDLYLLHKVTFTSQTKRFVKLDRKNRVSSKTSLTI